MAVDAERVENTEDEPHNHIEGHGVAKQRKGLGANWPCEGGGTEALEPGRFVESEAPSPGSYPVSLMPGGKKAGYCTVHNSDPVSPGCGDLIVHHPVLPSWNVMCPARCLGDDSGRYGCPWSTRRVVGGRFGAEE